MARSTYFDLGRSADACPGSASGYAQRFQCGNIVKRRIWTRMMPFRHATTRHLTGPGKARENDSKAVRFPWVSFPGYLGFERSNGVVLEGCFVSSSHTFGGA